MAGSTKQNECRVREGKFVDPCHALAEVVDCNVPGFSKKKGVFHLSLTNLKTRKPSRSYIGIRSSAYPEGMAFNFCPFCGVQIDQPFNPDSTGNDRLAEQVSA